MIGNYAFNGCYNLKGVTIPNTVTNIGTYAFESSGLTNTVTIPSSVTTIGVGAFADCTNLNEIKVDAANISYEAVSGVLFTKGVKKLVQYPKGKAGVNYSIPTGVTSIDPNAFYGCNKLTDITIPSGVTTIGSSAFEVCSGLTSMTIPNSVTTIGSSAFEFCSGLTNISISSSVKIINSYTFNGCTKLTNVIMDGVETIGAYAFQNTGLKSITIPSLVKTIGAGPFANCSNLVEIKVEAANTNYKAVSDVLFTKDGKKIIQYPKGKTDASYSIPNGITSIDGYAFYNCSKLTSVKIPDSVTTINSYAFYSCTGITNITIPDSVTKIDSFAFYGSGLKSIILSNNLSLIGSYAFYNCLGLVDITIPESVNTLNSSAFQSCKNLQNVYIMGKPTFYTAIFNGTHKELVIYGLVGSTTNKYADNNSHKFMSINGDFIADINAPDIIGMGMEKFIVWGYANTEDGEQIGIYINNNKNKIYKATVNNYKYQLEILRTYLTGNQEKHTISIIELDNKGKPLSAPASTATVYYNLNYPGLSLFNAYGAIGGAIDLIRVGDSDILWYASDRPFVFELAFNPTSQYVIKAVNICLEKSDGTTLLTIPARFDKNSGVWVAQDTEPDLAHYTSSDEDYKIRLECKWGNPNNTSNDITKIVGYGYYRLAIDPSGYVYEAVPTNTLEGVKATIYYQKDNKAVRWNAKEYQQLNPLYTDNTGYYRWDVPAGRWQVMFELAKYEKTYSDWLDVPPEQKDVNIAMVSKTAPTVENVYGYQDGIDIAFSKYMKLDTLTPDNIIIKKGNEKIPGIIEFINAEKTLDGKNEYASIIRFVPDDSIQLSGAVQLELSGDIKSYADIKLGKSFSVGVPIRVRPVDISASIESKLTMGQTGYINVSINPAESASGKIITAVSSNPNFVSVVDNAVLNAEGKASIQVKGNLTGTSQITLTLQNTLLTEDVEVIVDMPTGISQTYNSILIDSITPDNSRIDLTNEAILLDSDFTVEAYSKDGGSKWIKGALPVGVKFNNLFNKELTLWLTSEYDAKSKKATGDIVKFPKINARPKANLDKLAPFYRDDMWMLAKKKDVSGAPVIEGYEIAELSADKKTIKGSYKPLPTDGFKVLTGKVKRTYLVRSTAKQNGETYIPASKTFKVTPTNKLKMPNYKINYKTEMINIKQGNVYSIDGGFTNITVNDQVGIALNISENISKEIPIIIKKAATGKKPVSEIQIIIPAARAVLDTVVLTPVNGKLTLDTKKYEVFDSKKQKWGSLPNINTDMKFDIRVKSTAAVNNIGTTGNAASLSGELIIIYGVYDTKKSKIGVINADIIPNTIN